MTEICAVAEAYDVLLMVDDAHGEGVLGEGGRGIVDHFGLHGRVDVEVGIACPHLEDVLADGEIGPLVASTSFHEPAVLAKMAMTIEEISAGRLILGLGAYVIAVIPNDTVWINLFYVLGLILVLILLFLPQGLVTGIVDAVRTRIAVRRHHA